MSGISTKTYSLMILFGCILYFQFNATCFQYSFSQSETLLVCYILVCTLLLVCFTGGIMVLEKISGAFTFFVTRSRKIWCILILQYYAIGHLHIRNCYFLFSKYFWWIVCSKMEIFNDWMFQHISIFYMLAKSLRCTVAVSAICI